MRLALAALLAVLPMAAIAQTWANSGDSAYIETEAAGPVGRDKTRPAWPISVRLQQPTTRYSHDVLGGIPRWGGLAVRALSCGACRHGFEGDTIVLPETLVFEDTGARLWDVSGDGFPEIVVVESSLTKGARLAVWGYSDRHLKRIATTEHIGRPNRWLAPLAVGDFDGDGALEVTYVDRPHLARELVFLRYSDGALQEIARLKGVTNHRIGDAFISGGARNCGAGDEAILVNSNWSQIIAVTLQGKRPKHRSLGPYTGQSSLAAALACKT
jgi:hypothetical protein